MRAYEAVFIFDPDLSEDELEQLKERIVNIINSNGNLLGINIWGKRKLAYPINKKIEGIYYIFEFMGDSTLPRELKRLTTITESIMRSIIVTNEGKTKSEADKEAVEASKETVKVDASIEMKEMEESEEESEKKSDFSEFTSAAEERVEDNSEYLPVDEINDKNEEVSKDNTFEGE